MSNQCIIMPLFNDWQSAAILIGKIDQAVADWGYGVTVVMVNDGSHERMPSPETLVGDCTHIEQILAIDLVCNLGHQRAIAVGLAWAQSQNCFDAVFVMDSDGEDPPHELNDLRNAGMKNPGAVITADRASRSEGPLFRFWYQCYKFVFYLLTGTQIRFGNFSHIPARQLDRLVHYPDLWNSLSGCIKKSGLPVVGTPSHRGMRYVGPSKMNFVALVLHGLSAIAALKEAVMVRLMIFSCLVCGLSGIIWLAGLATNGQTGMTGFWMPLLFLFSLHALLLLTMVVLDHLNRRAFQMSGPAHFWKDYVQDIAQLK